MQIRSLETSISAREIWLSFFKLAVSMPWGGALSQCCQSTTGSGELSLEEAKDLLGYESRCRGSLLALEAVGARGRHRSMSQPFSTRNGNGLALTLPNLLHKKSFPYAISIFTDSFCDLHAVLPA